MKGYYEDYSYVLIMPDGKTKMRIVSDGEISDYYKEKNDKDEEEP